MNRRFSILQEIDQLQREVNRRLDATNKGRVFNAPTYPAVNIWANEDGQVISSEMPGVQAEDIDIHVTGDAISISGVRKPDEVTKEARYHRRERNYGSFSRTVQLPFMVDTNKVEASLKSGVLSINLPRAEADKPKKITVNSK
jgi:HSP20 family protein